MNPIIYAIPVFLGMLAVEAVVARYRGGVGLRLNDGITSLSLGALSQVTGVFSKLAMIGVYVWAYEHFRVTTLPTDVLWIWPVALVLYDLLYYFHHRYAHEVGVLWAAHVVHHQSEEYNLSTALRQTSTDFMFGWLFFLPMALLGFPPMVYVVVGLIDLLYQFWIHTEQIGRLGWFDRWFASPSNHRVHHAVNDKYLDKNYGGIFMVWDRMFGTFIDEDPTEPVTFGTRAPLRSFNPLWANLDTYSALARDSWHATRWTDKLKVWLKHPGWRPKDVAERFPKAPFVVADLRKYDPPVPAAVRHYCGLQYLVLVAPLVHFLIVADSLPLISSMGYAAWLTLSVYSLSRLLEDRPHARALEAGRWALAIVLLVEGFPDIAPLARGLVAGAGALSLLALIALRSARPVAA
jgi:sterol desaturase/sphingolipid hydroxylase (fatty acid hydroxylase superfamily)